MIKERCNHTTQEISHKTKAKNLLWRNMMALDTEAFQTWLNAPVSAVHLYTLRAPKHLWGLDQ